MYCQYQHNLLEQTPCHCGWFCCFLVWWGFFCLGCLLFFGTFQHIQELISRCFYLSSCYNHSVASKLGVFLWLLLLCHRVHTHTKTNTDIKRKHYLWLIKAGNDMNSVLPRTIQVWWCENCLREQERGHPVCALNLPLCIAFHFYLHVSLKQTILILTEEHNCFHIWFISAGRLVYF